MTLVRFPRQHVCTMEATVNDFLNLKLSPSFMHSIVKWSTYSSMSCTSPIITFSKLTAVLSVVVLLDLLCSSCQSDKQTF